MIRVKIRGRKQVIANLKRKHEHLNSGAKGWVQESTNSLFKFTKENISLTCHSYAELARLGHPYGKKHLNNPHSPYFLVHTKSGDMQRALSSEVVSNRREIRGGVGFTQAAEDSLPCRGTPGLSYLRPILFGSTIGTGGMVPRNFLWESLRMTQDNFGRRLKNQMREAVARKI